MTEVETMIRIVFESDVCLIESFKRNPEAYLEFLNFADNQEIVKATFEYVNMYSPGGHKVVDNYALFLDNYIDSDRLETENGRVLHEWACKRAKEVSF